MGYDVHLVRTEQWFDAESDPVTREHVDKVVATDPTLSWSESDYVEMTEDDGSIMRYYMINWNGAPSFWWYKSEVRCKIRANRSCSSSSRWPLHSKRE
jgi:hypothetical protein